MNQSDFEADLRRQGYQVFYGGLKADHVNTDHSHDWDARVIVIGGEIMLRRQVKSGDDLREVRPLAVTASGLGCARTTPRFVRPHD